MPADLATPLGTPAVGRTPAPEALTAGSEIGGYRIEKLIGKGGMGVVYKAVQLSLNREVALKVLGPKLTRNPQLIEGFVKEARAAGRLQHPNLVVVHDVVAEPARNFYAYAMEYVPGPTASQLVQNQGPLKRPQALQLVHQIARALSIAHKQDLVHRDIKPDNILVSRTGTAKLLDLGLVRDVVGGPSPAQTAPNPRRLRLVGTPEYGAPEQMREADDASTASDVYSLGATLYFLLTGRPPFVGRNIIDTIVLGALSPIDYPAAIPADCRHLIDLMMAKDPDARFPDGEAVVAAIEAVARGDKPKLPDDDGQAAVPNAAVLARRRRRRFRRYTSGGW